MKTTNQLATLLIEGYSASPISKEDACIWLKPDEIFITGFRFCDPKDNYRLIALREEHLFTEFERSHYLSKHMSPYTNMLAIIYKSACNEFELRIVNGIAGVLGDIFNLWKITEDK